MLIREKLSQAVAFICEKYPYKDELSNARLTKMMYLADWKNAIESGHQISDIEWQFNHYGPYVSDVKDVAQQRPDLFAVKQTTNLYGDPKTVIYLKIEEAPSYDHLTDGDKTSILHVIEHTKSKNWRDFISLIYSTYPVATQPRYSTLNLVDLANKYKSAYLVD